MRYHFTQVRMTIIKKFTNNKCQGGSGGFPGGSSGKESACNVGDLGSIPGLGGSPGGGHGNPLQYPCLANRHGQRSLAGCSPWSRRESDTTERLSTVRCKLQRVVAKLNQKTQKMLNTMSDGLSVSSNCSSRFSYIRIS